MPDHNADAIVFSYDLDATGATYENGFPESAGLPVPPAFNVRGEPCRDPRLIAAWGHACATVALMSRKYQHYWAGAVLSLNDHKGHLEVTWRDRTSRIMFEGALLGAWERVGEHSHAHQLAE